MYRHKFATINIEEKKGMKYVLALYSLIGRNKIKALSKIVHKKEKREESVQLHYTCLQTLYVVKSTRVCLVLHSDLLLSKQLYGSVVDAL